MAIPTSTVETYDQEGIREDLESAIYDISPTDTPFMSNIGRTKMKSTLHEWQLDQLADPDEDNAAIEGDDAPDPEFSATTKVTNRSQISTKTVSISGTADAVTLAGRSKETGYQVAKKSKELKRDMEKILCRNQGSDSGGGESAPEARKLGALEAWYETNTDFDATSGADGGWDGSSESVARTDSSATRAITENMLKNVLRDAWTAGGEPTFVMCGGFNKQAISAWTGQATRTDKSEDKTVTAAVDVYKSDFGDVKIVPNRFSRAKTVHVLDLSLWAVMYLRKFRQWKLAKTGDSNKRQLLVEYSLRSANEAGSGGIFDLTTS